MFLTDIWTNDPGTLLKSLKFAYLLISTEGTINFGINGYELRSTGITKLVFQIRQTWDNLISLSCDSREDTFKS